MTTLSEQFPHVGELRVTQDATLVDFKRDPINHRGFVARVEWEGEDLKRRFASEIYTIGFGMKSALAQGGIFGALSQKDKTYYPDVDITDTKISATLLGSQYSSYPMEIWEGMEFGRFYNQVGAPFRRADLLKLHAQQADLGSPIYAPPEGSFSDQLDEEGALLLTSRNFGFRVRADYDLNDPAHRILSGEESEVNGETAEARYKRVVDQTGRIRLSSRKQLKNLFECVDLGPGKIIKQNEFIVVDTHPLVMPPYVSGLLMVDEVGMRIQPIHLNSPIVDSPFGHDTTDEYNSHLRLELYQTAPRGLALSKVYVRLRFFREQIISAIAPEEGTGQSRLFRS